MLANLKTEMEKNRLSIDAIAQTLNLHRNTISSKLSGETVFSIEEAFSIKNLLFPYADLQYLFRQVNTEKSKVLTHLAQVNKTI